jgi:hypothetical protein
VTKVSEKHLAAIQLYANLMEEVKIRVSAIEHIAAGKTGLAGPISQETFYLQLRMICELVALGALVAHGDIKAAESLKSSWKADEILKRLEDLHPSFFPRRAQQISLNGGRHLEVIDGGLTKKELITLYVRAGDYLHKGNLKKLLKAKSPVQIHFPILIKHVNAIVDLLNFHVIALVSGSEVMMCMMRNSDNSNRVQVALAQWIADLPEGTLPGDYVKGIS